MVASGYFLSRPNRSAYMNKIVNHLPTKDLQALDAAHHMHPFTENAELSKKV